MSDVTSRAPESQLEGAASGSTKVRSDWIGEPLHLAVAMIAIVLEPISTATASIGFISLVVVTLLRIPFLIPAWRVMLAQTWIKLLLAWLAWTALSIAWSPDIYQGFDRLAHLKYLLWLPCLLPLGRQWRWLLGAFLAAAVVLQGIQLTGVILGGTPLGVNLKSGLRHATMTGMWDAAALGCCVTLFISSGRRIRMAVLPLALLSALGVFWAGQRAPIVGLAFGLVVISIVLIVVRHSRARAVVTATIIGIACAGAAYAVAGASVQQKFTQTVSETSESLAGDASQVMEVRLALWKLSLSAWQLNPIFGVGLGGYQEATAGIEIKSSFANLHIFDTPHSAYILALTESGVVGLALFAVWAGALCLEAIRCLRASFNGGSALCGVLVWFACAAFDSFQTRGVFLSVGVILTALAVMPPIERARPLSR